MDVPKGQLIQKTISLFIFRNSFDRFRIYIMTNQNQIRVSDKAKWVIYDKEKFKCIISDLKNLIEELKNIIKFMADIESQKRSLRDEVIFISDVTNLEIIRDVFADNN
jgi:hypothetical protein